MILDDDPKRQQVFRRHYHDRDGAKITAYAVAYTANEAIDLLLSQPPFDIVQLDHDLGGQQMVESGPGTGEEVARATDARRPAGDGRVSGGGESAERFAIAGLV